MKKIISLFQRNYEGDHLVRNEVVPGAEWVLNGEGIATQKWDGTCCLWFETTLWKRFDCKEAREAPSGFIPAQDPDPITKHWPGWVPITDKPEDIWFREALVFQEPTRDGTYELCGPKINGNPEGLEVHQLIRHGAATCIPFERTFDGIREFLANGWMEGIVWHRENGDMVKIKAKDFGIKRLKK